MSYIVPKEIPKNCIECPCGYETEGAFSDVCSVLARKYEKDADIARPNWCPLIEVKTPHGRLIDADKFKADHSMKNDCAECEKELQGSSRLCEYDRIYSKMDFCEWIDNAVTVIGAEE